MNADRKYERLELPEGPVEIRYPAILSLGDIEDFEYWAAGVIRRVHRLSNTPKKEGPNDER